MNQADFQTLVEQYKAELMAMAKLATPQAQPAAEPPAPPENDTPIVTVESPETQEVYDQFIARNPRHGELKIQASTAQGTVPVEGAQVTVSKDFGDETKVFYSLQTDKSGLADEIVLPAPDRSLSQTPSEADGDSFETYDVTVEHPEFRKAVFLNVPIFDGVKSIQPVRLVPLGVAE